ncbi:hypothetical protein GIB67_010173 [Kingdonia uniflora]|uniref:Uncharacterized protein n=1 Tax=Kingdonia uniflora TaxID=39325 RepID=A0A7J7NAT8_9MAGN|nr:hypothetical protein GIB67_010173 [Kingdonia uniflora]
MMKVCEALNKRWRDGGIMRQFIADDVLKYYKFKYVKDRKSGYLFSDSARPKFFNFESAGRPWYNHFVMVRGNCIQVPGESALELIYKNFSEKPNPKGAADTSSLFDVVSQDGTKLSKVLEGVNLKAVEQEALDLAKRDLIRLDTQIRSSISQLYVAWKSGVEVSKVAAAERVECEAEKASLAEQLKERTALEDVDLALAGKYSEITFPGDYASPIAKQSPAPQVADGTTKEEVVRLRGKVSEMEKALSRARDFINRTQQGKRVMRIIFFNIKKEDRRVQAQLENGLGHARDELEICKDHNACLVMEKVECNKLSCKDAEILTANNEAELWKESLKKKKLETMAANQQVLDLLSTIEK